MGAVAAEMHDAGPGLGAIARAMLKAGCTDAQIGAALRLLADETVEPSRPATVSKVRRLGDDGETVGGDPRTRLGQARAALTRARGLTPSAMRVGAALLDRYNARLGYADPSIERIAEDSGVSRPGVFRAVKALEGLGILRRHSYGGQAHCNAYSFDFTACAAICGAMGRAQPSQRRGNRLTGETQTQRDIYNKLSAGGESERETVKRPARKRPPDRRQIPMMLPMDGGRRPAVPVSVLVPPGWLVRVPFDDMPGRKAVERLWTAYDAMHKGWAATNAYLQAVRPEILDSAIAAEKHRAGKGLGVLTEGLDAELGLKRSWTGPP